MEPQIRTEIVPETDGTFSVVIHIKNFFDEHELSNIKAELETMDNWEGGEVWGNPVRRVQNWYHVDGTDFGTHWKSRFPRWTSKEYPTWLMTLQVSMQEKLNTLFREMKIYDDYNIDPVSINSVLLNKYRDGNDSFRLHKDDIQIFGDNPNNCFCYNWSSQTIYNEAFDFLIQNVLRVVNLTPTKRILIFLSYLKVVTFLLWQVDPNDSFVMAYPSVMMIVWMVKNWLDTI